MRRTPLKALLKASVLAAALALATMAPHEASAAAFSLDYYVGNGTTSSYAVTFPYIQQSDVGVYLNGSLQTSGYTWTSPSQITFTTPPAASTTITFQRTTTITAPDVVFQPGTLASQDLNTNTTQALYLAQEAMDRSTTFGVSQFNGRIGGITLQSSDVSGALGFTPAHSGSNSDITSLNGLATVNQAATLTVAGGVQASNSAAWIVANRSGALTTTTGAPPGEPATSDGFYIQNFDTVGSTGSGAVSIGQSNALNVYENFSTGNGPHNGLQVVNYQSGATAGNTAASGTYTSYNAGLFTSMLIGSGDGGTSSAAAKGNYESVSGITETFSGSNYLNEIVGAEFDMNLVSGSSANGKEGLQIVSGVGGAPYDTQHGLTWDFGLMITSATTNDVGFNYGIQIGKAGFGWPIPSTGTIMGTGATANSRVALYGIDLSGVTFQSGGCAFKSTGFCVDPSGNLTSASLVPTTPLAVAHGGTGDTGTAWTSSNLSGVVTCPAGSLSAYTGNYRWKSLGKTVFLSYNLTVTSVGTCTNGLIFNAPVAANSTGAIYVGNAIDATSNVPLAMDVNGGSVVTSTTPAAHQYVGTITYESN